MTHLPRTRPSAAGVDPAALLALVDALDASPHEPHSLMVLRHGSVVAEGWWAPYRPELPHLLYSLSKAFTATAAGLAIEEGLFGLDDRLVDLLPGHGPTPPHERVAAMTVRHALTMTTGHATDPIFTLFPWILEHPGGDWLDGFFELVPEDEPGRPFTYNQLATYSVARAVEARTGGRLLDYLAPRLFAPLGIDDASWLSTGGHDLGFAGLHLRTESIAAFGQLCLQAGRWGDRRLVPADWMRAATSLQVSNRPEDRGAGDQNAEPDWNAGYGYQFWMCRHGYRGDGALGQFCIVWPDEDVVIATTAAAPDMQALLDLIDEHLGGALDRPGADEAATAAAEADLTARCAGLSLPTPVHHGDHRSVAGRFARTEDGAAPSVAAVTVTPTDDGWTLCLDHRGGPAELPVGLGRWTDGTWPAGRGRVALPTAAAGGITDDGRLRVEIVLTQTPHRLILDLHPATGAVSLAWNQFPLHGADPGDLAVTA